MRRKLICPLFLAACLVGAGLHADAGDDDGGGGGYDVGSAAYLMAGADAKVLTNTDANDYFSKPGQYSTQGYADGDVRLGFQFGRWAALEASFDLGPFRDYEVVSSGTSGGGLTTSQVKTDWNLYTYSLTPGVTWAAPGFVNFLGLRLGVANLAGQVNTVSDGLDGSYDQRATAPDIGILFRTSAIFLDHISVGLELGYDYTVFNNVNNYGGTGNYSGISGRSRDENGSTTTLNFSGPHIGIVLGLWTGAPVTRR